MPNTLVALGAPIPGIVLSISFFCNCYCSSSKLKSHHIELSDEKKKNHFDYIDFDPHSDDIDSYVIDNQAKKGYVPQGLKSSMSENYDETEKYFSCDITRRTTI